MKEEPSAIQQSSYYPKQRVLEKHEPKYSATDRPCAPTHLILGYSRGSFLEGGRGG